MKEISPVDAHKLLEKNKKATLIDVRSSMEYDYVGHPVGALPVPVKQPPDWETMPDFIERLQQALSERLGQAAGFESIPLLMLCRSGKRSELAATLAEESGFTDVYNIIDGFESDKDQRGRRSTLNGCRFHQLPWEQS